MQSRRAWQLAARQHGIVTRAQLLDLGFTSAAIEHRLRKGRLHSVARGVYAVGWPQMTTRRRWITAVLACGGGAAISHRSAAALWQIGSERSGVTEVSVRRETAPRRDGVRARRRPALPAGEIVVIDDIPVTAPVRTLLDLATVVNRRQLERAVNEADKREIIGAEELRSELHTRRGAAGVRRLRALLDRHTFRLSDSELEVRFRRIVDSAGLPAPISKAPVNGFEVDFFWPDLGLVVETDGLRYHRTAAAQARDQLRDQAHTAAGLAILRFSHRQVMYEPAHVRHILRQTLQRLRV